MSRALPPQNERQESRRPSFRRSTSTCRGLQIAQIGEENEWLRTKRYVLNLIEHIGRFARLGDKFEISDALSNCDVELMGKDDTGKGCRGLLSPNSLSQEIFVLAEQDTPQGSGAIKKFGIRKTCGSVFLGCEHIHSATTESVGNRFGNVHVHIEGEAQGSCPMARNRFRKEDCATAGVMCSTSRNSCSMTRSMSS